MAGFLQIRSFFYFTASLSPASTLPKPAKAISAG